MPPRLHESADVEASSKPVKAFRLRSYVQKRLIERTNNEKLIPKFKNFSKMAQN